MGTKIIKAKNPNAPQPPQAGKQKLVLEVGKSKLLAKR